MTTHRELDIKRHFNNNDSLTVDVVNEETGEQTQETFYSQEEAIRDINNLECEFEVYF